MKAIAALSKDWKHLPCFSLIKQGRPSAIQETQLFQNLHFIRRFCCGGNFFSFPFDHLHSRFAVIQQSLEKLKTK